MEIIVKSSYNHINSSFKNWDTPVGRRIRDKDHYERVMREEGMVSSDEKASQVKRLKDYKLSAEAEGIIRQAREKVRSGGLKLSDGVTQKMIEKGIIKPKGYGIEHLPEHLKRGL